ncbi:MAG: glycosyltransferase [Clostridia bacterium]|nr:glycosyltransferase [Clostridia bacterium]
MRFLIHIPQLIYGGAEKVLVDFANYLVKKGHEVEILETYDCGLLKPQFDKRVRFNVICSKEYTKKYYASLADIKADRRLTGKIVKAGKLVFSKIVGYRRFAERLSAKYYKNKRYDVAINYLEIENPKFILSNINANKYFQWIHTDVKKLTLGELDMFVAMYEKMDYIICVSETAYESMCELYPSLISKTHVIYNFFDIDAIKRKAEEKNDFKTDGFTIVSIGRMVELKGYSRAIDVLKRLNAEGYGFAWYIIGDGGERTIIEEKIKAYGLENQIKLLGLKDNPYPYIKACNLFFLPSLYEGFPTVTIEAKVLNKPVLATEVSGIREQIENGKTGIIVENSKEGIYQGLKKLLDEPMLLKKLSDNSGMQKVLDNDMKYEQFMNLMR